MVEQSLQVLTDRAEVPRSEKEESLPIRSGDQPDTLRHVPGVEQLIPIPATAEDEDGPAETNPFEDDRERSHALGPDEGLRAHDGYLEPSLPVPVRHPLRLRSGCPVRLEPTQRRVAKERVHPGGLRHDRGRDQNDASNAPSERLLTHTLRAFDVHAAN